MCILRGEFDPIAGARISTQLAATTDRLWRDEHGKNPTRPESSVKQRRADALETLICGSAESPASAPPTQTHHEPATTLLVIADLDTVAGQLDNGRLANATPVPAHEIARLACEADIVPALFNTKNQPLWLGRSTRLATPAQRIAVIARDQGCIACGAAPEWCQVHHIDWWTRGGPTDIDRLCLLCSTHHHLVHEEHAEITATDTGFQLHRRRPPSLTVFADRI
ncbi:MAG: DUF222 domain-containing protein, partial [Actinomycetia bacterium]|nr:DUF222 domain-containing protein [Actinomycetes bacterium]